MRHILAIALLGLTGAVAFTSGRAIAQETVANMPIADLHFHPGGGGKGPNDVRDAFDRSGVRWFGNGAVGAPDSSQQFFRAFGNRVIIWAGQQGMDQAWLKGGTKELDNANYAEFTPLLANFATAFAEHRIVGIGELFVNNIHTSNQSTLRRKMDIDGAVIRALFALAAKYEAFVGFHMEGDADSVAQLERLAASNRRGKILLNHCGVNLPPAEIDRLLTAHLNLFCEVSVRYPPTRGPGSTMTEIFNARTINAGWKDVIVKHADRFMVGTDAAGDNAKYIEAIATVRSGLLANLPIDVARKVAYGNAVALFGLK